MVAVTKPNRDAGSSGFPAMCRAVFWTHNTYQEVANDFHKFHQHDLNCALHLVTTTIGVWGVVHLVLGWADESTGITIAYTYMALVALTTPWRTALIHTALMLACLQSITPLQFAGDYLSGYFYSFQPWQVNLMAIVAGYGLQDVAHWLCVEPTFMDSYLKAGKAWMLLLHNLWLLPLVIDSVLMRSCFLPSLLVSRNRNVITTVASKESVTSIRRWIRESVEYSDETTHIWPHMNKGTDQPVTKLEHDKAIEAAFRTVFPAKHFDVKPVQDMNEIYVTAVGSKKSINSDRVFYTPHTDGPFWFLPGASLYRVLVGVTPNQQVRTRFNMQHVSQDQILDRNGVVGFDYNRELHWIDHVPGVLNMERRSVVKLHYIVYPRGWHRYGQWCAMCNTAYNTWARGNFLQTLRPDTFYDIIVAWWIWFTTRINAGFVEHFGWNNLVYIGAAYLLGGCDSASWTFLILTSFRHYAMYVTTFAYRQPMVAIGCLMRDAKIYKTISMMHLARRLLPMVELPRDSIGLLIMSAGFVITLVATARLGMVRTYFGTELGFVKPKWIDGFPYGMIPHPMIGGQLWGFGVILYWFRSEITIPNAALLLAHMACYAVHMFQEILYSSY